MRSEITVLRPHGLPSETRFWMKVLCDLSTGCWLWQGDRIFTARGRGGYGMFYVSRQYKVLEQAPGRTVIEILDARRMYAHRYCWELLIGPVPTGYILCHRCDVPSCVRPDHLFVGSHLDNNRDMWAKGRAKPRGPLTPLTGAAWQRAYAQRSQPRGEQLWNAKLTVELVREMRALRESGAPLRRLAELFGVHLSLVHRICTRQAWAHVD
jgi:hypothetical protein